MIFLRKLSPVLLLGSSLGLLVSHAQISGLAPGDKPSYVIDYDSTDKPTPSWENGYVLAHEYEPLNAPLVSVFGPLGSRVFTTSLALGNVVRFTLRSMAASSKGVFAVSGGALDANGIGANVIVFLDSKGTITRVVRLKEFAGNQLCFADDNRLWVLGRDPGKPSSSPTDDDMIRVYDDKGAFQQSLLRRSLFSTGFHPAIGLSYLAANGKNVVLFSPETGYLVLMSKAGEVVSIRQASLAPQTLVTGLALTEGSQVVLSAQTNSERSELITFHTMAPGASRWTEIYSQESRDAYDKLFGSSGENLLVGTHHPFRLSWVRIQR